MKKYILNFALFCFIVISTSDCDPENVLSDNSSTDSGITIEGKEESTDYTWSSTDEIDITLNGTSASCSSSNVSISSGLITILKGGNYVINGTLSNGQLLVNADTATVKIKLNGVSMTNTSSAPFYGKKAGKIIVFLNDGTANTLTDASSYSNSDEPNACMFSNCYMAVTGSGNLTISANYNDGISGDDGITINSGNIKVTSKDDGIRGKDFLKINNGTLQVTASAGHALKSDNDTDKGYGYVRVLNGTLTLVSSQKDGIHAAKRVIIDGGVSTITASSSQALNSDSLVIINGGTNTLTAKEGIEGFYITITGGVTTINATNDGINATAGTVSGGAEYDDNSLFSVKGGLLIANCSAGDAIDSNGGFNMSGGTVIANGPQSGIEESTDINGSFNMTGGFFMGAGAKSNMQKSMSSTSTQANMFIKASSAVSSSSLLHIEDASGNDIATLKPKYGGYYFLFSSPDLAKGGTYNIYTGGSYNNGTLTNGGTYGIYSGGSYSKTGATLKKTITLSTSTTVNTFSF